MNRILLLLLPLLTVLQGCTKEDNKGKDDGGKTAIEIESSIGLLVSDDQGNDLLNPTSTSPKAVDFAKVKLYFIRNGKEELYDRKNSDIPRGLRLLTPKAYNIPRHELMVHLDCELGEKISTIILDWGDGRRDVFKTEFYRPESSASIFMKKVWLNDELVWEREKAKTTVLQGIAEIEITR